MTIGFTKQAWMLWSKALQSEIEKQMDEVDKMLRPYQPNGLC